jgi:protein-S-isoprenylcysteine O-methyltransferase
MSQSNNPSNSGTYSIANRVSSGMKGLSFPPSAVFQQMAQHLRTSHMNDERDPLLIATASFSLGALFIAGIASCISVLFHGKFWTLQFGLFVSLWSAFHVFEFFFTALSHPSKVKYSSFLINHSRQFHTAMVGAVIEYSLELWLFPTLKLSLFSKILSISGGIIAVVGQYFRSLAMWQAGRNFTHIVATEHKSHHVLVTDGLYKYCRHPAYAAWFVWAFCTQLILVNPICAAGYTYVIWHFFRNRIVGEEERLVAFFGDQYREYQKKVPNGIPFLEPILKHQS